MASTELALPRARLAAACEDMYNEGFYVAWAERDVSWLRRRDATRFLNSCKKIRLFAEIAGPGDSIDNARERGFWRAITDYENVSFGLKRRAFSMRSFVPMTAAETEAQLAEYRPDLLPKKPAWKKPARKKARTAAPSAQPPQQLSEYELARQRRIALNKQKLGQLGLGNILRQLPGSPTQPKSKKPSSGSKPIEREYRLRKRSSRVLAIADDDDSDEDHDDEEAGQGDESESEFEEDEDEEAARPKKRSRAKKPKQAAAGMGEGLRAGQAGQKRARSQKTPADKMKKWIEQYSKEAVDEATKPKGSWDEMLGRLREWQRLTGTINVSRDLKPLGKWVDYQRRCKKGTGGKKALTQQQIAQLDGVGFLWDAVAEGKKQVAAGCRQQGAALWETSFAALKQCAFLLGLRLIVRGRWRLDNPGRLQPRKAENPKLYEFCKHQRDAYRNEAALKAGGAAICKARMPAERQQKLEQMAGGFDFLSGAGSGN